MCIHKYPKRLGRCEAEVVRVLYFKFISHHGKGYVEICNQFCLREFLLKPYGYMHSVVLDENPTSCFCVCGYTVFTDIHLCISPSVHLSVTFCFLLYLAVDI